MQTNAQQYYETVAAAMKPVRTQMPDVVKGFRALHEAAFQPGTLSVMEKELIALGIGLSVRCENCIYSHIQACLKAGATREQILEAASVAVLMQGGPTYTYLPRVVEALDILAPVATEIAAQ
ncbi:MAG: carboxymuconolactone decarboxylase family protein [Acidobacteriaceae bacterium]|jgi:AhpD family alkylhydroperoxidase|nr:carboxymuconolactone decarboxylase family protein [Acidobacteriaceae bacterium]